MLTPKRVAVATICGFGFGLVCMGLASSNPDGPGLSAAMKWTIIVSRTLTGFTIGISALPLAWWLHGILIGCLGSIPMALPVLDNPDLGPGIAVGTIVMGVVYGFLTEVITSVLVKAKPAGRTAAA